MKEWAKDFGLIFLGSLIYVIGINIFIVPAGIFSVGLMGLAQESATTITRFLGLDTNTTGSTYLMIQTLSYWAMNLPAIFLGFRKVGVKFTFKTMITSFVIVPLLVNFIVLDHNLLLDINGQATLATQILSAIIGGCLTGLGMGIIFKKGASSGGTDIVAIYLSIFKGKSFGIYNILINMLVMIWSIILFKDINVAVVLLILIYVQSQVIDYVYNFNEKRTLLVVTNKEDEVRDLLINGIGRTYTKLEASRGYSKEGTSVLLVVVNKEEEAKLVQKICAVDEQAFIDSLKTNSVSGNFVNKYRDIL